MYFATNCTKNGGAVALSKTASGPITVWNLLQHFPGKPPKTVVVVVEIQTDPNMSTKVLNKGKGKAAVWRDLVKEEEKYKNVSSRSVKEEVKLELGEEVETASL
jgi:hypothetical protein